MTKGRIVKGLFAAGVGAVVATGALASRAEARRIPPGGCVCPLYYAPVQCSNGVTYSNICFAGCAGATGCVPVGPGPVPL